MDLLQYFDVIRKWVWLIILATVLAAGSSLIVSLLSPPIYRTTTTLMVSQVITSSNPNTQDIFASQQLAQTYVQLIKHEPIMRAAASALGFPDAWQSIANQVSAVPLQGTQLIEVSVVDSSPERAQAIANEVVHQLILQSPTTPTEEEQQRLNFIRSQLPGLQAKIQKATDQVAQLDQTLASANSARVIQDAQQQQDILNSQISQWTVTYSELITSINQANLNYLSVVEQAPLPLWPISPNSGMNVLIAGAIGFTLALAGAFLLEYLDDTIRSPDEVRSILGAPILTLVGKIQGEDYPDKLVAVVEPRSPVSEAFRTLRTNLQFSSLDTPLKTIIVTSSGPAEGKSITASNLAVVLAQSGLSVVLVDADLRRPVQHKIFGLKNRSGLTNWLVGQDQDTFKMTSASRTWPDNSSTGNFDQVLQTTKVPGLKLISSGPQPPNPAEVLGSTRMHRFLTELSQQADVLVLDSPPCVTVTDAAVLSRFVDGVLMVVDSQHTHRGGARRAKENMDTVGAKILGVVINRLDPTTSSYFYSYYSYYTSYNSYYYSGNNHKGSNGRRRLPGLARLLGSMQGRSKATLSSNKPDDLSEK